MENMLMRNAFFGASLVLLAELNTVTSGKSLSYNLIASDCYVWPKRTKKW